MSTSTIDLSSVDFSNLDDWTPMSDFIKDNPKFSKGQMESLTRPIIRESNGMDKVVKLIGRTLYIHTKAFSVWMSKQESRGRNE